MSYVKFDGTLEKSYAELVVFVIYKVEVNEDIPKESDAEQFGETKEFEAFGGRGGIGSDVLNGLSGSNCVDFDESSFVGFGGSSDK
ncbi:MAG: hypothetical protein EZS28_002811 [Streblomastix strix]|uniref:Uncharacterized protein n=1 Tax=Streblomastix strix TaxID=222440 RepID=A0A5J4X2Y8_9EUKA|nr:MAG: hypothetical protein EZS28_002811 [Streblomastix strix]